jgi:DNA-binding CsgD family transcriptional regulator
LPRKQKQSVALPFQQSSLLAEAYVLCERSTGAVRFRVEADSDGSLPVDKIAALSAVRALGAGVKVSRREREVLDCVCQYLTNKEIATRINVSERTVKFHVSSLLAKFGVTNRMGLTREVPLGRMPTSILTDQIQLHSLFDYVIQDRDVKGQNEPPPEPCPTVAQSPRSCGRVFPMVSNARLAN